MMFKTIYKLTLLMSCAVTLSFAQAQKSFNEQHIEVAMRTIGHQLLLKSGDSTSLVLPIIKENERYKIQFAKKNLAFQPEDLVAIAKEVIEKAELSTSFILEVEQCDSTAIVYSHENNPMPDKQMNTCMARALPASCYNLLISFNDLADPVQLLSSNTDESGISLSFGSRTLVYIITCGFILFLVNYSRKEELNNPHIIPLGEYQFDKRNTELRIDDHKIELTGKEAELLILLYDSVNTTVERNVILNMVWGDQGDYVGRTLDVFISKLRKKLEQDSNVKIVNIRGVGYKLVMNN